MLVVSLPGCEAWSQSLARELGAVVSPLFVRRFPDGEALVRIDADVAGRDVVFAGGLDQPDGKTLPLLFAADAARELGARSVGLAAPYLAYMRQDARFMPGEAISSRSYARLLSSCVDYLATVDPHLHRWSSLDQIYRIPTAAIPAAPAIAAWLQANVAQPWVIGPDAESEPWVRDVAARLQAPWTVLAKTRDGDRDVRITLRDAAVPAGRTPVLLDDIVSSGATLAVAAGVIRAAGCTAPPVAVVVHALFAPGAAEAMRAAGIARVASCDSVAHASNAIALAPAVAAALPALLSAANTRPTGTAPAG